MEDSWAWCQELWMGRREEHVDNSDPLKLSCTSSPSETFHSHRRSFSPMVHLEDVDHLFWCLETYREYAGAISS